MKCSQNLIDFLFLLISVTDDAAVIICCILLDFLGLIASSVNVQFCSEFLEIDMLNDA